MIEIVFRIVALITRADGPLREVGPESAVTVLGELIRHRFNGGNRVPIDAQI
jgi:hypothetical protein